MQYCWIMSTQNLSAMCRQAIKSTAHGSTVFHDICGVQLQVNQYVFKQRVLVKGFRGAEEAVFEFRLIQRRGGWFTEQLICDDAAQTMLHI